MDDIGNIGYILFFIFLIIVNAVASANKRKKKKEQQQREQEQSKPEAGERTKSLEDVMRELLGGPPKPKPRAGQPPGPVIPPTPPPPTREFMSEGEEQTVRKIEQQQKRYANPMQEVVDASVLEKKRTDQRRADQEQLEKLFRKKKPHESRKQSTLNLRQAVIHSEILLKPRWTEY